MQKKILLMGPIAPPYTGQSIAFTTIAKQFEKKDAIILNLSHKDSVVNGLSLCLRIIVAVLFHNIDTIYFTCSRSFLGSIRDVVLLLCARLKRIKVVNHLHGNTFYSFYHSVPSWYRMILKYVYNGVDTSIVLLPAMREQFRNFPKMKIKVVANCYSSELDDLPLEKHKEDKAVKLLYLSNIMESKGIILLLEACDTLFSLYPDLSLKIAGTFIADEVATQNNIKQKFENHYNTLKQKYPNQIDYVGVVSGRDKNELLWESDIFILPTYYPTEAFPLSIIESMRAGNYIISTFHNLIPKIVTPDNGTLVEPRSTEAIVAAVKNCCSEKSGLEKIQNDNIEFAVANYNERKYVEQVVECCC